MTMDSTVLSTADSGDSTGYPLDPLTGAEIEAAAGIIKESEYHTPTMKFVMIQLAEPDKTAELTFEGVAEPPRRAFVTDVRRGGEDGLRGGRRPRCPCHRFVAGRFPAASRRTWSST